MAAPNATSPSFREYQRRMNLVLDQVERHYDQPLSLKALAQVAGFSPYHFHRVFTAVVGQSVYGWLNRVRLERAAQFLRYHPNRAVTDVALSCGFSTPSNFARAFKLHFGVSASTYRSSPDSKISQAVSNPRNAETQLSSHTESMASDTSDRSCPVVTIETLPGYRFAYVRHFGDYGAPTLAEAWATLLRWAQSRGLVTPQTLLIGVPRDDDSVTLKEHCRYDACIAVDKELGPTAQINYGTLPLGTYAVCDCRKVPREIANGWEELYSSWLPNSGFLPDWGPGFELYAETHPDAQGQLRVQYCIPIRPL